MASPPGGRGAATAKAARRHSDLPETGCCAGVARRTTSCAATGDTAFTGNFSALLSSHDKDVSPNLSGSAIQAVLAAPYVGTRVELSAVLRGEGMRNAGSVWMYVTDPSRVIIAYQVAQMSLGGRTRASGPAIASSWTSRSTARCSRTGSRCQGQRQAVGRRRAPARSATTNVPVTGPQNPHQVGVIAQAVSADGALANPTNLDFEDVQITRERQPPPPPDEIKGTRF